MRRAPDRARGRPARVARSGRLRGVRTPAAACPPPRPSPQLGPRPSPRPDEPKARRRPPVTHHTAPPLPGAEGRSPWHREATGREERRHAPRSRSGAPPATRTPAPPDPRTPGRASGRRAPGSPSPGPPEPRAPGGPGAEPLVSGRGEGKASLCRSAAWWGSAPGLRAPGSPDSRGDSRALGLPGPRTPGRAPRPPGPGPRGPGAGPWYREGAGRGESPGGRVRRRGESSVGRIRRVVRGHPVGAAPVGRAGDRAA